MGAEGWQILQPNSFRLEKRLKIIFYGGQTGRWTIPRGLRASWLVRWLCLYLAEGQEDGPPQATLVFFFRCEVVRFPIEDHGPDVVQVDVHGKARHCEEEEVECRPTP